MAGIITICLTQRPGAADGKLHFIRAGTVSTPQNAFYDLGLTLPLPNPLTLDSDGNIPLFYFADGYIKIQLVSVHGTNLLTQDNVPVYGASSGGGSGGSVDPTTVYQTGQMALWYGTGVQSGFVRANGRTIGSATSGATELANTSAQALFLWLYAEDANLAVSGGRGVSAAADWAANKTIALPDFRGRGIAGLDDMGNSAASRLTASYFGTAATALGAAGGAESQTLTLAQAPTGITSAVTGTQQYKLPPADPTSTAIVLTGSGNEYIPYWHTNPVPLTNNTISGTGTSNNTGGAAHPIVQPTMLATIYIKL